MSRRQNSPKYLPPLKSLKGCGKKLWKSEDYSVLNWKHGKRRQEIEATPLYCYQFCGEYRSGFRSKVTGKFTRVRLLLCQECQLKNGLEW